MCAYDIPAQGWGDEKQRGGRTETMPGIYMDFGSYTRFTLYAHPKAHTRGEEGERREKTGTGGLEESPHGAGPTQKRNKEPTGLIQPVCLSCRFLLSMLFCRSLLAVGTWGSLFVLVGTAASSRAVCVPSCLLVAVHACISSSIYQYTVSFFLSIFPITPAPALASGAAAAAPPPAAAGVAVASAARRGPAAPPPPAGPPAAASRAP